MKGILFGGCSFTWGQGLYFYSELNRLINPINEFTYRRDELNDAHFKFRDTLRFPRLVANHFNTFEVVKLLNGGSEDETFEFFDIIFDHTRDGANHLSHDKLFHDDIEYIVIQTSQIWRNKFWFELDGVMEFAGLYPSNKHIGGVVGYNEEKFLRWMSKNNVTLEQWMETHKIRQFERLKEKLLYYENLGIKTKLLCWETDLLPFIKKDLFFDDRLITFEYKKNVYDNIWQMHLENKELTIKHDPYFEEQIQDHHPSKECHRLIANAIIKSIENDKKTII
jgi:hypothetical protein